VTCLRATGVALLIWLGLEGGEPVRKGVSAPGVQRPISQLHPQAVFAVEGAPDWMAVTDAGIWVASEPRNQVVFLDARANRFGVVAAVSKPCSGLAAGFGAIWAPSCGDRALQRIDPATGKTVASVPVAPADSEGGIATGAGSVWMLTDAKGVLSRIDPRTNKVSAQISVPDGSFACTFADGAVWVSCTRHNLLSRVDPQTNQVTAKVSVGPQPRFVTAGGGAVWTLNQGDGSISRVDARAVSLAANIPAGVPGSGGEIAYGEGAVWVTMFGFPITKIDPAVNRVVKQWTGPGGDSIRAGLGSVWLTDLKRGKVMRFDAGQL
jgi:virginiamycin B lyase